MLDEPTNDLDLETLDLLQEVIADYEGTVLIVSHDRDFLDRTVTITLGLDGSGKVDVVAGGYEDWVRKRYQDHRPRPAKAGAQRAKSAAPLPGPRPSPGNRNLSYKDQRDYDRLPGEIERLEADGRGGRGGAPRPRPLCARSRSLRRADRAHRPQPRRDRGAELRWLEVAEMAEALAR